MEVDQNQRRRSSRREANRRRREFEERNQIPQENQEQVNGQNANMEIINEGNQDQAVVQQDQNEEQIQVEQQAQQNPPLNQGQENQNQQEVPQQNYLNPLLQQQQNQETIKVSPAMFSTKIPNIDALRDFFMHKCQRFFLFVFIIQLGRYCPTTRDMTTQFAKKVLAGQKKLLKLSQVKWVNEIPRYKEISSKAIWSEVKSDKRLTIYMPDFPQSRLPQKAYLLNVMNTVRPNSVIKYISDLRKKREMLAIEESPIIMTAEFSQMLSTFQSITSNRKARGLNGLRTKPEMDNCCICFSIMNSRNPMMWFQCKRHKAHRRCVNAYYRNRQDQQYLCPFRCEQVEQQEEVNA